MSNFETGHVSESKKKSCNNDYFHTFGVHHSLADFVHPEMPIMLGKRYSKIRRTRFVELVTVYCSALMVTKHLKVKKKNL